MRKKISIYAVIFIIFSASSLLCFLLGIDWWKAELISLTSSLLSSLVSVIVAYLTHNGKPNA